MRTSITELPITIDADGYSLQETTWGEMHVEIAKFYRDYDVTPLLKGLPDDMDPVSAWGYVFKGRLHVTYKNGREEAINAGDIFYLPPAHTIFFEAGTELVMFGPEEQVKQAAPVVGRNYDALQQERQ